MFSPGSCWVFFLLMAPSVQNLPVKGLGKGLYALYPWHMPKNSNTGKMLFCVCPNHSSQLHLIQSTSRAAPLPALNCLKDYLSWVTSHQCSSQKSPAFQNSQGIPTTSHPPCQGFPIVSALKSKAVIYHSNPALYF